MRAPFALFPLLLGISTCRPTPVPSPSPIAPLPEAVVFDANPEKEGLRVALSSADPAAETPTTRAPAATTALSAGDRDALLRRLPAISSSPADEQDFAVRKGSLPAPRAGATVAMELGGAPAPAPVVQDKELRLLRHSPEGKVPMAPSVSLTFSQPMIALGTVAQTSQDVPVKLDPQPAGAWRWVGTQTLLFEPDPRMPMATRYTVTVPAGTPSATGVKLAKAESFLFETPPARVLSAQPVGDTVALDAPLVLAFDQRVDPAQIASFVKLSSGSGEVPLRLANTEEITAWEAENKVFAEEYAGRVVQLRATRSLSRATAYSLVLGKGAPSSEGPLTTTANQTFNFHTYGDFKVVRGECGWGSSPCPPPSGWWIELSNPIDLRKFDPKSIRVEPSAQLQIQAWGNVISLEGQKAGRKTYTVTLPASLRDSFGQTLGKEAQLRFAVGPADPYLVGPSNQMLVVDPATSPGLSVATINHDSLRVEVYAVTPESWATLSQWTQNRRWDDRKGPPLKQLAARTVSVQRSPDERVETRIPLAEWLPENRGQLFVRVVPTRRSPDGYGEELLYWVQSTDIGLTALVDGEELVVWASSLRDGRPLEGVEVQLAPAATAVRTDAQGLARLPLADAPAGPQVLLARKDGDLAVLPARVNFWSDSAAWYRNHGEPQLAWLVFDDRGLYKPGEKVSIKGWIRQLDLNRGGDVGALGDAAEKVRWRLDDSRGNTVAKGEAGLSEAGGFDLSLALPDDMNLGTAYFYAEALSKSGGVRGSTGRAVQVEEFRRPEFEVGVAMDGGPHLLGQSSVATVDAHYYAGGGLGAAPVSWSLSATASSWRPPNHPDFSFGRYVPWWRDWMGGGEVTVEGGAMQATTDAAGQHLLKIEHEALKPARPLDVSVMATVQDLNNQAWTATSTYVLHPAGLYVGLKSARSFVEAKTPVEVEAIVVDLDGKARPGVPLRIELRRSVWEQREGAMVETVVVGGSCTPESASEAVRCTLTPDRAALWQIVATLSDSDGRSNESELNLWVSGEDYEAPGSTLRQDEVELVPSGKTFAAGETAEIFVRAPFFPAEGLLTVRRSGLEVVERFTMEGPTTTLRVPIEERYVPNVQVSVTLVGQASRGDAKQPSRPAYAVGALELEVPPLQRTLSVSVTPRDRVMEPGGSTELTLEVRGADGLPVAGAELAVVVADEAVLALTGYRLPNPLEIFYQTRSPGVEEQNLRAYTVLDEVDTQVGYGMGAGGSGMATTAETVSLGYAADGMMADDMPAAEPPAPGAPVARTTASREESKAKESERSEPKADPNSAGPVAVRQDFSALALFAPAVRTDGAGVAKVPLKLPDNLTRYRVMVIAVDGAKRFGSAEADITARRVLMVRPSAPRFLNYGDRFELPVLVQNQGDAPLTVTVAARGANLEIEGSRAGQRVTVPPNDRVELRFPAAAKAVGKARFQVIAASGAFSDAAEGVLPVWTPATAEAFATYGQIDQGAVVQPIRRPEGVFSQFGGLEVSTSSTALQALTDAMLYLVRYPYECSEQMSSRVLAVVALRDVLTAFEVEEMPTPEEMEASVAEDVRRLAQLQNWDGGWGFWRRGERSWPYLSIHVAHALVRAEGKGYAVPADTRQRAMQYLRTIERHIPSVYSEEARRSIIAYALWVRHVGGDSDPKEAKALLRRWGGATQTPMEALGWLLPVVAKDGPSAELTAMQTRIGNNLVETAGAAHFVTSYSDGAAVLLHSDRRVDGILLDSLIEVDPKSDVIPKLVKGLLDHRKAGRWTNTQENAFILLALDRYFRTYEAVEPDFVARAWLGDRYVGEHGFRGRSTERAELQVPMQAVLDGGATSELVLAKEGAGRMYYRVGLRYAPESLVLDPLDAGFTVERVYEGIDDPADVRRDETGVWHIRAGARVRVRLTMVNSDRRYHVALIDPLPAGLEPLNPSLANTGALPEDPVAMEKSDPWWWWSRPWYEHQNLRDERVEAFASLLWDGVHSYSYVARATTPGQFIVPPARAEEMYAPETFGRTGTDRVVVE